ncbi:uncharacterized protein J3R85_013186 [Psidium guajava]|nr:uncharacterized protein J3R85_013186 [Psidium guajava]
MGQESCERDHWSVNLCLQNQACRSRPKSLDSSQFVGSSALAEKLAASRHYILAWSFEMGRSRTQPLEISDTSPTHQREEGSLRTSRREGWQSGWACLSAL